MTNEGPRKMLTRDDLLFTEEVYQVVGAAMDVHRILGPGFLEAVYQEALAIELERHGIPFVAQVPLKIAYRDGFLEKRYIADFIVHGQIIVEIKSLPRLGTTETAQILNYLRATSQPLGLLINFGAAGKLEWKRLANTSGGPSRSL
ncbi:MAG TPA: GxxExxY protein [Holophagaceae bacterium]|nr:GxxExxY protein [Holophagaceae bacterium]